MYESSFFKKEMDVIDAAMDVIQQFNDNDVIDRHIYLNQPDIWEFTSGEHAGQKT